MMHQKNLKQTLRKIEPDRKFKQMLRFYLDQKLSVIPLIAGAKEPALDTWKPFQERRPTKKQIEKWFYGGGLLNIGIVCGSVSQNLVVLDFEDSKIAYKLFGKNISKRTFTVVSGSGKGLHIYWFTAFPVRKFKIQELALDVQGTGSYVAAPPSLHPSGNKYTVDNERLTQIAVWKGTDFEEELYEKIQAKFKKFEPQKHREAVDIEKRLGGVEEGMRNEAAIRLATWYRRSNKTEEQCETEMVLWNEKLETPMTTQEIQATIRSAYGREEPYKYWFKQNPETFKEIEQYSREDEQSAEQLLNTEEILPKVEDALTEIIGETKSKVGLFLLELADQSIQIGGQSATGKNYLIDLVSLLYPKDHIWKITGVTDKSIRYLKESVGTLYIAEWRGMGKKDEESTAVYDAKLVISEGKLRITVVEKSKEHGRWETKIYENNNIRNIITSSTDIDIPRELKTRIWYITLDETAEQTRDIAIKDAHEVALPPSKRIDKSTQRKIFRCAMKKLLNEIPKEYIIPYMPKLLKIFNMNKVRVRRDKDKLKLAIYAVAALHHRNRPKVEDAIVCMPQDFYWAWQYLDKTILGTFSEKEERFQQRWKIAEKILNANKKLTSGTYAVVIEKSIRTSRNWLKRFVEAGLLLGKKEGRGGEYIYCRAGTSNQALTPIKLKIADLFDVTEQWLSKFGNSETRQFVKCKKNFSDKIILIPSTHFRLSELIDSLPDAPSKLDVETDYSYVKKEG